MSDTVDTDIEANAILNSYMYRVLQKTLPRRSWEEWGAQHAGRARCRLQRRAHKNLAMESDKQRQLRR